MPDALFLPAEIVAVDDLSDEESDEKSPARATGEQKVPAGVEAIVWCAACECALREDLIEAGETECQSCFEEATYER